VEEGVGVGSAGGDGQGDGAVDGGGQRLPSRLAQVRQTDGDDEEGLEPFPESDDEGLKHGMTPISKVRLSLRMSAQSTAAYPTGQVAYGRAGGPTPPRLRRAHPRCLARASHRD